MARRSETARVWYVRGRVQGVAQKSADSLGLTGYTRNLDDGRVEVYAVGTQDKLSQLAGLLHTGPRWADVRGVEEQEAPVQHYSAFVIEP